MSHSYKLTPSSQVIWKRSTFLISCLYARCAPRWWCIKMSKIAAAGASKVVTRLFMFFFRNHPDLKTFKVRYARSKKKIDEKLSNISWRTTNAFEALYIYFSRPIKKFTPRRTNLKRAYTNTNFYHKSHFTQARILETVQYGCAADKSIHHKKSHLILLSDAQYGSLRNGQPSRKIMWKE